jgi:transposase
MRYLCRMINQETITIPRQEYQTLLAYKDEVSYLTHQLAELKRLIFGSKSERFVSKAVDPQQGSLFEVPMDEPVEQKQQQQITYKRNKPEGKKHPLRAELPAHLPRIDEVIEPQNLPGGAKMIGEIITEVLILKPGKFEVRRIRRPKYVIESTDEKTTIITADLPRLPIPKGNADASLLSHILINKYVDHLPLYRQSQMFKRMGITIAGSTLSGWFTASCKLLEPLYQTLKNTIIQSDYLQADETPIPVLTKDKPGATHKGYHWVYNDPVRRLVFFDYRKTRSREGPNDILKNFSGHLQTDGYESYNNLKNQANIILLACMAHARRYFDKAKDNDAVRAEHALKVIQKLYAIERQARDQGLTYDQIKTLRHEKALPILNQLEAWLKENIYQVLPKSAIGKAISYTLNLWPRLIRYLDDGRFQIDNNLIENTIRPVALGRKNYLFAGSHDAAQYAAIIYSLLACCKLNDVEPFQWLTNTLNTLPNHPENQLHTLLPRQK